MCWIRQLWILQGVYSKNPGISKRSKPCCFCWTVMKIKSKESQHGFKLMASRIVRTHEFDHQETVYGRKCFWKKCFSSSTGYTTYDIISYFLVRRK